MTSQQPPPAGTPGLAPGTMAPRHQHHHQHQHQQHCSLPVGGRPLHRLARIAGLLGAVLAAACSGQQAAAPGSAGEPSPVVDVAVVRLEPQPLDRTLVAVGSLEPVARVQVAAQEEGVVTAVTSREGDRVEAGTSLVLLDDRRIRAEVAEAEAVLDEAEARQRRSDELHAAGLLSDQMLDSARASARVAAARLDNLRARLSFTHIEAPVTGTVIARHVEVGDLASPRTGLLELAAGRGMLLRVPVSELEVVYLERGDAAEVKVDALPELKLAASIARIFPAADATTRQVTVELLVPEPPPQVRLGFLARARLVLEHVPDALLVPEAALQRAADLGSYVWVVGDGAARARPVATGAREHGSVHLIDGVQPGELVVVEGMGRLQEGSEVRLVEPRAGAGS